ncbi:uncharacterized protein LOC117174591 [Belonocnema kinseyi]|uniref:uncharacterized protein LOC117174591 n=1 Tax=Belonocnema kinseyi TaxID=2817044 RepID=UPI00143D9F25|nr:uncharacterized protein LOC117174591 [Belonocnema kinseyi]
MTRGEAREIWRELMGRYRGEVHILVKHKKKLLFKHNQEPDLIKAFHGIGGLARFPENFDKFVRISLEKLRFTIEEKWKDEEYQEIACKLRKIIDEIRTRLISAFEYDADEFCVLNHGDFWTSNVMFKCNEKGNPCDALIVDFQLIHYTSPAIDLQHFLAMCPEFDVRGDKDDYFLENYRTILKSTMKKIGCKTNPPTMEQLKKAIRKRGAYSILIGLVYYPRIIADKEDVESFNDLMKTGTSKMDIFKNPLAVKMIK